MLDALLQKSFIHSVGRQSCRCAYCTSTSVRSAGKICSELPHVRKPMLATVVLEKRILVGVDDVAHTLKMTMIWRSGYQKMEEKSAFHDTSSCRRK